MVASSKGQYFQNTPTIRHRRYPILSQSFDEKTVPRSVWKSRLMGRFLSILFLHRSLFHDSSPSAKNSRYSIALLSLFLNPENRSEITRIHVGSFEGASSSTTHDIIGSPRRHPASSTPRAKFNFFGCNRSNLSDISYYFATKLYTKFFFPFFPHTHTRLVVSRSSPFRTLFQLSGIRERNYRNSDFYPIFHLENSIVSCFVRMVHARYQRSDRDRAAAG